MNVKLDGLTLHVEPDYNPPHPRTECDHLGKMLCWHRNYIFGDQNRYETPEDFYRSEEAKNIYVSLPVYMLDHSGTFLSTRGFADVDPDRWDWGQIGIIYCTEEAAKKWFGYLPDKEMLKTQLNGEVVPYSETAGYVKKVRCAAESYKKIYGFGNGPGQNTGEGQ